MRSSKSHILRAGLLAGTGFAAFIAAPAMAQDPSAGDELPYSEEAAADPDLNVITVTARRREERLIDVPI